MKTGLEFHGKLIIETFQDASLIKKYEADNTICIAGLSDVAAHG